MPLEPFDWQSAQSSPVATPAPKASRGPNAAWKELLAGNQRFVEGKPAHPNQDASRRAKLTGAQEPFVTLFGCSDSRVAAEMIFDVGLGEMFVVRTAGQVTDGVAVGSLEYGVGVLGTPLLVVLGHDNCGAITAAIDAFDNGKTPGGFITDVVARILPSIVHARANGRENVIGAVTQNTIDTVHRLPQRSAIIGRALKEGRLVIIGLTYQLADGRADIVARLGTTIDYHKPPSSGE